jgi:hypothetical protein
LDFGDRSREGFEGNCSPGSSGAGAAGGEPAREGVTFESSEPAFGSSLGSQSGPAQGGVVVVVAGSSTMTLLGALAAGTAGPT